MKKIPTLFERVYQDHKVIDVKNNITPGCEDAFLHGIATLKIDGSCCAIINGEFYRRYDAKHGKPVPVGAIKCQEEADPITGHLPCWLKVDPDKSSDKWYLVAFENAKQRDGLEIVDATYEAIGPHFQTNPYDLEYDTLVRHGQTVIEVDRTFEAVREYLRENYIEGIVFWLDGHPVCKAKRSDFGFGWKTSKH